MKQLSNKEKVLAFNRRHKTLPQKDCPEVVLYCRSKKGYQFDTYFNATKGLVYKSGPDWIVKRRDLNIPVGYNCGPKKVGLGTPNCPSRVLVKPGANINYIYGRYDEKLEVLELSVVAIDSRVLNREARKWHYDHNWSQLFFVKGEYLPRRKDGELVCGGLCTTNTVGSFSNYMKCWKRLPVLKATQEAVEAFAEGKLYLSCGESHEANHAYWIAEWLYKQQSSKKKKGGKALKLEKLLELKLLPMANTHNRENIGQITNIIQVDNIGDISVIRYAYIKPEKVDESYRVYVLEKDVILAAKTSENNWGLSTNIGNHWIYNDCLWLNEESLYENKRLKYLAPILKNIPPRNKLGKLIALLRYPLAEQLYKAGYENIFQRISSDNRLSANIANLLGKPDLKQKSLPKKFGLNAQQLNYINNYTELERRAWYNGKVYRELNLVKRVLEKKDLSDIDFNTFIRLLKIIESLSNKTAHVGGLFRLGMSQNEAIKFWLKMSRIGENIPPVIEQYNYCSGDRRDGLEQLIDLIEDINRSINSIPAALAPAVNYNRIKGLNSAIRLHDEVVMTVRAVQEAEKAQQDKEIAKRMAVFNKKREKWEYQDDKFLIRLPKTSKEIRAEGNSLHHCVGGYVYAHANGETTILFLREKNNPEASFYTIEVKENWQVKGQFYVVQIHGFGNRWLGNNPEAIPSVMRWLNINNFTCSDNILLSTAKGYSSHGAPWVKKPVI